MDNCVLEFFCGTEEEHANPLLGERKRAQREPLRALANDFYRLHGWDPDTGYPTDAHLRELGLGHVLEELAQRDGKPGCRREWLLGERAP